MLDDTPLHERLGQLEPSPRLLLELVAWIPSDLLDLANQAASFIPDPELRLYVLALLARRMPTQPGDADAGGREWQRYLDEAEAGAGGALGPDAGPPQVDADLAGHLDTATEVDRSRLLEPVLQTIRFVLTPVAANGGGDEREEAAPDEVSFGVGNGGGEPHAANGGGGGGPQALPPEEAPEEVAANGGGGGQHAEPPDPAPRPVARNGGGGHGHHAKPPSRGAPAARRARVVSTGFSVPAQRRTPLSRQTPLTPRVTYLFWVQIGPPVRGSIEVLETEVVPAETLKPEDRFQVVLFSFPHELGVAADAQIGEFAVDGNGRFEVARQPDASLEHAGVEGRRPVDLRRRMYFPVTTPAKPGTHRLRCSIYFRNVLVQSRVVTAFVGREPARGPALSAKVDFQLARLMNAAELTPIRQHIVSIQLNSNGAATHNFRFAAFTDKPDEAIVTDAVLGANALQNLIDQARGSLRQVAWGSRVPWVKGQPFRYEGARPDMTDDLFELMRKGRQLYDAIINPIAGGPDAATALRKRMLKPGRVQIVSHGLPSELVPTSLIYDYPNVDPVLGNLVLCPTFLADLKADGRDLVASACFSGECPSLATPQVVCPSGFWGFRHAIGEPVSLPSGAKAAPFESTYRGSPALGMAFYPGFKSIDAHRKRIAEQQPGWTIELADTYSETLDMLRKRPHVVYFFCHGGISAEDVPYLQVGLDDKQLLSSPSLRWDDPERYRDPRSLVILNGCETSALEPDRAMSLVTAFVQNVAASGVIGTEITVYEELASSFGEVLLTQLRSGTEVGEAVRIARLAVLKDRNPLGLVYLPLVASDARLVAAA